MTVVAAAIDRPARRVHLAADTRTVHGDLVFSGRPKIFTVATPAMPVLFGFAGDAACGALVAAHLRIDDTPTGGCRRDIDAWATATACAVTEILLEHGRGDLDHPSEIDGEALMAWRDRLWLIGSHLAAPIGGDYWAIGSGREVAIGAMWAGQRAGLAAADLPRHGVEAAAGHVAGIGGDTQIHAT